MTAEEFNETFALCHFLPGPNIVNFTMVFGSRFRGIPGGIAAFAGLLGPPVVIMTILARAVSRFGEIEALRHILAGVSCAAVGLLISVVFRMMMPLVKKRDLVGACRHWPPCSSRSACCGCRWPRYCWWRSRSASPSPLSCAGGPRHEFGTNPIWTLAWTFGRDVAVCGRRRQFRDSRNAPGRGRRSALDDRQAVRRRVCDIADVAGAERADRDPDRLFRRPVLPARWSRRLAMCVPTALLAYCVSRLLTRSSHSRWPAIIQAALVPLSIGLMGASGLILALSADRTWVGRLRHRRRGGRWPLRPGSIRSGCCWPAAAWVLPA